MEELLKEIEVKRKCLELIYDLAYDYDGSNTVESLKSLIDELIRIADIGLNNDLKAEVYFNGKGVYNILNERIGDFNEEIRRD